MAEYRHLSNAPISEAIFHLMVNPRADISNNDLGLGGAQLKPDFTEKQPIIELSAQFTFGMTRKSPSAAAEQVQAGFRFSTSGKQDVVSFAQNYFSMSRLPPYTEWEALFVQLIRLWRIYCSVARPRAITRVAARFINRLELPFVDDLSDYVVTEPRTPAGLPMNGWLARYSVVDEPNAVAANVVQAMHVQANGGIVLLLDNDVFRSAEIDPGDETALKLAFDSIHGTKNKLFFSSLTEAALTKYA